MHSTSISKCPGHTGTATKNTGRRSIAKVLVIDFIDFRKLFYRCAKKMHFNTLASDEPAVSTRSLLLFEHEFCLSFNRRVTDLAVIRFKRGTPRVVAADAMPKYDRGWSLASLHI